MSTGCVCSVWRRAKPSSRWTKVLARSAACSALASSRAERAIAVAVFALQQVERAGDRRQQIVEVVGDAAGQLAERLQLLRFVQLRHRRSQLGGALLDPLLEIGGELVELLEPGARLILPAPAAQRRLRQADEGGRMERPLQEGDVAEQLEEAAGLGIALEPAAALGQQDEREVGPFGLRVDPAGQGVEVGCRERFLGDDGEARRRLQSSSTSCETSPTTSPRMPASASMPRATERVAALRRKDQRAFGDCRTSLGGGSRASWRSLFDQLRHAAKHALEAHQRLAQRDAAARRSDIRGSCPRARRCAS